VFGVPPALTGRKGAGGSGGRSGAMVADAVHSCSDMATDVVVIAFAKISAKPRDDGHDYGHGKYETLATIIISLALAAVGAGILLSSIRAIRIVVDGGELPRPGAVALSLTGSLPAGCGRIQQQQSGGYYKTAEFHNSQDKKCPTAIPAGHSGFTMSIARTHLFLHLGIVSRSVGDDRILQIERFRFRIVCTHRSVRIGQGP